MTRFPVSVLDLCWGAVGALLVGALLVPPQSTGTRLGIRRFLTPEISSEWKIGQAFSMNVPDLNAVEIRPAAVGPIAGRFQLTMRNLTAGGPARARDVSAADLVSDESYVFTFRPFQRSAGDVFLLEMTPAANDPGRGVALRATRGPQPQDRGLLINDLPRWASLAFQTHTPRVSLIRALVTARDPRRPPRWLALVGLFGGWIALRFVLRAAVEQILP